MQYYNNKKHLESLYNQLGILPEKFQKDSMYLETAFEEIKKLVVPEVYMRCVTWTKDSNGLFDYESKNISKKNIKTQTGGRVIRIGEEVQLVAKSQDINLLKPKLNDDIIHEENCECHLQYMPQKMLVLERELKEPGTYDDFIVRNDTLNLEKVKM